MSDHFTPLPCNINVQNKHQETKTILIRETEINVAMSVSSRNRTPCRWRSYSTIKHIFATNHFTSFILILTHVLTATTKMKENNVKCLKFNYVILNDSVKQQKVGKEKKTCFS